MIIAIHPDQYTNPNTPDRYDDSSPRWAEYLRRAGHRVKWVDVRNADILDQLHGCHAFMWRWGHFDGMSLIAHKLLPIIENQLGLLTYPNQNTCWLYDDKVRQHFVFSALAIPIPKTWVWFTESGALKYAESAIYPLVLKLSGGAMSGNVILLRDPEEAVQWIQRLFQCGILSLSEGLRLGYKDRLRVGAKAIIFGLPRALPHGESHRGYVLFQEFLPGNEFDTRVTVIGNRAFGFRRFNRDNDFRASGSGKIDWNPQKIDPRFIRLGFHLAQRLGTQSLALDGLYREGKPVILEMSYTYASWAVHNCPGHWELHGEPDSGELQWIAGNMWPEQAQIDDFLVELAKRNPLR